MGGSGFFITPPNLPLPQGEELAAFLFYPNLDGGSFKIVVAAELIFDKTQISLVERLFGADNNYKSGWFSAGLNNRPDNGVAAAGLGARGTVAQNKFWQKCFKVFVSNDTLAIFVRVHGKQQEFVDTVARER